MEDDPLRPVGQVLAGWTPPPIPGPDRIESRYVSLERLDPDRHAIALFDGLSGHDAVWDYMSVGPFADRGSFSSWVERAVAGPEVFYAFRNAGTGCDDPPIGYACFMRIDPAHGVLEIGNVMITPAAQRSRAASAALMAMIGWAFDAGYRRVEWKCNALNAPSRRAACRYGFTFEGIFRSHMVIKGRNRDTAWYAMTKQEWPSLESAYARWLDPQNFDASGTQIVALGAMTGPVVQDTDAAG